MDGRTGFVIETAVRLIHAGGVYKSMTLGDVIAEVIDHIHNLDDFFNPDTGPVRPEDTGPH